MDNTLYREGVALIRYDDETRTVSDWTTGVVVTRPYTAEENASADARAAEAARGANEATIRSRAATALAANNAFLALSSPTNAQVLAQTKVLTRENTALIKLALGLLDDTTGT